MAELLNGKALAQEIHVDLTQQVQNLRSKIDRPPGLAVLIISNNPASAAYVANKERACMRADVAFY